MNEDKTTRVRFAPSPTGYLHVGGVRTALFNWLFARKRNGTFILRIEDTDKKRSTEEALKNILDGLKWLGIDWDEGPYFQSERLSIYNKYAEELIEKGFAYKSNKSRPFLQGKESFRKDLSDAASSTQQVTEYSEKERDKPKPVIDEEKQVADAGEEELGEVVVFKSSRENIVFYDLVLGKIAVDTNLTEDFVIVKSDGMPTYHFACVVDDALMKITHVIRGDDHVSNTPRQIMIYKALGFDIPKFAHVPMILGADGGRLSKRHGATSATEYREQGILPGALVNFMALLGWSPGENKEVITKKELIDTFGLKRITGKSAVFNPEKLSWMNSVYLLGLSDEDMVELCRPFLEKSGLIDKKYSNDKLLKIIPLFKKRIKLLSEISDITEYFFKEEIKFNDDAKDQYICTEQGKEILKRVKGILVKSPDWASSVLEPMLREIMGELGIKTKDLMQTIRAGLTGRTASAGIFETIDGLGRELVLKHLDQAIDLTLSS